MRLVLDTNVIVSAFINPSGKPSQIVKMILGRKAELCYNSVILSEYESVMLRPKFSEYLNADRISRFISLLRSIGISFDPFPSNIKLQDLARRCCLHGYSPPQYCFAKSIHRFRISNAKLYFANR